jgi:hypothetical protein
MNEICNGNTDVFKRILWLGEEEAKGGWIKLYNKELYSLYSSVNIIRLIRSRRMRLVVQVARMGEMRTANET